VLKAPGEALDDKEVFCHVARTLGIDLPFRSGAEIRAAIARDPATDAAYANLAAVSFAPPLPARHWLQASNPSERWKWDFLFQDLPPVKRDGTPVELPELNNLIPLMPIHEKK
jgi:hypothetical protein